MEFRLLGPLEVVADGRLIELGTAKERTLLAVLLLHANETVSTERLIDELWGRDRPASAAKLVQTYVSHLRRALGELIVTRPRGYSAQVEADSVDALRFERMLDRAERRQGEGRAELLRAALALWRGPALGDLWFQADARHAAERLEERRLTALARSHRLRPTS